MMMDKVREEPSSSKKYELIQEKNLRNINWNPKTEVPPLAEGVMGRFSLILSGLHDFFGASF